ncbi:MAG: 30S ribosomal protein S2 [Flavobacteriales bacterium]|nr:30S ribosomal protein S2 [Bacteroidales bacterium AH-315-I05]PCJ84931.1 MAG: 30S ribosomal protein S2 [Flavobacteriales bacterium]
MSRITHEELLEAGVHFGHLKRKWNPSMAPYIFMEKNGIHIIDLHKTAVKIEESANAMKQIAKSGKKILFVATKKQAKGIVEQKVKNINMPYVTERWMGGMLTNFATIRKAVRKMSTIDKMKTDGTFETMSKKERLMVLRKREKLERDLGSMADLTRLPAALFVVDIMSEHIAVAEARKLNIPIFGIVDTNSDPKLVDFPIPANDDASKSIEVIVDVLAKAVQEGLEERRKDREKQVEEAKKKEEQAKAKAAEEKEKEEAKAAAKEEKEAKAPEEEKTATNKPATKKASAAKATANKKPKEKEPAEA